MNNLLKSIKENPILLKYQVFLMPIFSFMICILLLVFLIIPQLLGFAEQNTQRESLFVKKQQLEAKIASLNKVNLESYKSDIATALIALPQEKDVPAALSQVLYLLSSNRLRLNEVSLSGSDLMVDGVKAFQIRVDATGTNSALRNFTESVKSSTRILSLEKLVVTAGSSLTELEATIDLIAYFEPLPTAVGGVDQEIKLPTQSDLEVLNKIKSSQVGSGEIDTTTIPLGKTDLFQ